MAGVGKLCKIMSLQVGIRAVTGLPKRQRKMDKSSYPGRVNGDSFKPAWKQPTQATCEVQYAHLRASTAIELLHSGQTLVAGAAGSSPLCMRAIKAFTGSTTK